MSIQSISSASDSSLSAAKEVPSSDREMDRDSSSIGGGTFGVSNNIPAEDSNINFVDALQPEMSNNIGDANDNAAVDASSAFIVKRLKELYQSHVLDAEKRYHLHFNFCLPTDGEIKESEFDATPMVLLIGQYSTGKVCILLFCAKFLFGNRLTTIYCRCCYFKTTFLNHLLGEDFPGMHIGPEPTTDKFMALYHGGDGSADDNKKFNSGFKKRNNTSNDDDSTQHSVVTDDVRASGRLVKGNTLTVTPNLPFSSLSQFGSAFLNHFVGSSCNSPLLKRITFIDTPGVLSGEKQRINRTYDFGRVAKWFADRSDLILLLFDAREFQFVLVVLVIFTIHFMTSIIVEYLLSNRQVGH
jgi:EH domain-containing protein 1